MKNWLKKLFSEGAPVLESEKQTFHLRHDLAIDLYAWFDERTGIRTSHWFESEEEAMDIATEDIALFADQIEQARRN